MDEFQYPLDPNKFYPISPIPIIPNPTSIIPTTPSSTGSVPILETSHIFWMIIDSTLMLIILSGNILTICAVHFNRKLSRTIANQFILNLAISDCFVGLTLPYHLIFYLDNNTFGQHKSTCLLRFVLITMACSASIYNLIAIALDRYIAIVYPLHYNRYMTKKVSVLIIICGWVLSTAVSTLPVYWNRWDIAAEVKHTQNQEIECELHIIIPKYYVTFVMVPYFAIVWATLFILYVRIWREAVHHAKRLRSTTNYYQNGFHKRDWKSIQVVLLVLGCFSICWLPYLIVACFEVTDNADTISDTTITYKTVFSLAMINSGMNPIIYAWKNTGFRTAFKRLLTCQSPDCTDYNPSYRNQYVHNNNSSTINNQSQKITTIHTSDPNLTPNMLSTTVNQLPVVTTCTTLNEVISDDVISDKINCDIVTVNETQNDSKSTQNTELVLYSNDLKHNNSTFRIITNTESDLEETVT